MDEKRTTWLESPAADAPCTVVAEIAQAHDGSLGQAHAYIDAAAAAGADAIKFQTHIAAAESTAAEPWRTRFSQQDETRFDYWRRMEFKPEHWHGLKKHADEAGIMFLSSPFSPEAVELLTKVGVAGWKVASGEVTNLPMLEAMAATGLPVILSTGMSPWPEIDEALNPLLERGLDCCVLQCTTSYPSPPESIGLNVLPQLRDRYGCAVGLSDHSGTVFPGLAAANLGVQLIEVHLTMSREMFGPDVVASVTSAELKVLTQGVQFMEKMNANPVDKAEPNPAVAGLRDVFFKSIVSRHDLPAGHVLTADDLAAKKPGTGISAKEYHRVVGQRLNQAVTKDTFLHETHFAEPS